MWRESDPYALAVRTAEAADSMRALFPLTSGHSSKTTRPSRCPFMPGSWSAAPKPPATQRAPASELRLPSLITSRQPSSAELSRPYSMNSSLNRCRSISYTQLTGFYRSRSAPS